MSKIEKVVLAYSGGLDTSAILKWIKKTYECEVITMTADLGQGEELDGLEDKALSTGATKAYVVDLQEEFVSKLTESIDKGVGRLVDADMNEESTRLKALQTQQQLAIQSLSIANSSSQNILSLFR